MNTSKKKKLKIGSSEWSYFDLKAVEEESSGKENKVSLENIPYSIRVLLESALRNNDGFQVTDKDVDALAHWSPETAGQTEIAFKPGRVVLQDFTGVPCLVDLAAMRSALKRMGGDSKKINPQVACDLVIDHSVQVDHFGDENSLKKNMDIEFQRNQERYDFLKWGQNAFDHFRIVPPGRGIVHQVNLECLAESVLKKITPEDTLIFPDSVVGTDSHTTMINGLGVVGWGVGGIEAESVMLGEPIYMVMPEVIGVELKGSLKEGVTSTDLVLTITEMLRKRNVVGKFVEFYGQGVADMSLANRATIANMAPEYGATMGFFPTDEETLKYLKVTGRDENHIEMVRAYMKSQGLFYEKSLPIPTYSDNLCLDVSTVNPSLAGPKRPHDRVELSSMSNAFLKSLEASVAKGGFGLSKEKAQIPKSLDAEKGEMSHGSVAIAAITSCTNTSNPSVLIAAGLVAQKAVERGLKVKPFVKTSLAPGSTVVTSYLEKAKLLAPLQELGFNIVGYGCTTCIGNSGPLSEEFAKVIRDKDLVVASVLSGNRNFEGRISPLVKANYLASPPLVVAYSLLGSVAKDIYTESLGKDSEGQDVYLKDIWPTQGEIEKMVSKVITVEQFVSMKEKLFVGDKQWQDIETSDASLYTWKEDSSYIKEPPFFEGQDDESRDILPVKKARVLLKLGDSVTTDHISPAGAIKEDSPAGAFLKSMGVSSKDFNSYGSRRGNDSVMTRGTFANIRLRNHLADGREGGWTKYFPDNELMTVYDASLKYRSTQTPLIVLAGKDYGTGSSRDWAAKGTSLLGVKVVIAESFERIHRSNLVGMGVLPLQFMEGESSESLGLEGDEIFDFSISSEELKPKATVSVLAQNNTGEVFTFNAKARVDTPVEVDYLHNGGILQTVLKKLMNK